MNGMNSQLASMFSRCIRLIQKGGTAACIRIEKNSLCSLAPTVITVRSRSRSSSLKTSLGSLKLKPTHSMFTMRSAPSSPADSTWTEASSNSKSISSTSTECDGSELLPDLDASSNQTTCTQRVNTGTTFSTNNDDDRIVVCVEGNIGCGKTTLLNYFENMSDCEVIAEPVEKWRSVGNFNPLALLYSDPARWALALQTYVQLTMLQIHTKPITHKVRLMERSIFSAKHCFVDNLYESGTMHEMEYTILKQWYDWILASHNIKVDLIVYLRTDPVQLHQRIMKRSREEEKSIPVEYLQALHQCHEDWLVHKKKHCPADVLVLDANTSLEQMKLVYEQHKSNILNARLQEAQNG